MKLIERLTSSYHFYRFLEALPGLLSWTLLIGPIVLAKYKPTWVAYFILTYSVYWVYNSIKFITYAYIGHKKMLYVVRQNWLDRVKERFPEEWTEYYYCSLIPFASESIDIIRPTVQSVVDTNFPNNRKILCLSSEKAVPRGKEICEQLEKEFAGQFAHIFITEHVLKDGEMKGKAANENHGGRFLYQKLLDTNIDPAYVLITSNDADVLNHEQYIAYLLYKFLLEGDKKHTRIYQPVPTDYTDHWNASFFTRLIITIGVQWRLALQQRNNYRCTVYSFYSMSAKTLNEIGFWDVDLIPEDERTQFSALFTYGKDFKVVPMFIPNSGNPVQAKNIWLAFKEQYKQIRRWAWGASEFAHSFTTAINHKEIPWRVKMLPMMNQVRTSVEWVLTSILPMFGGTMPLLLNEQFRTTTLAYALPTILSTLMGLASIFSIVIIYIEWKIAPKRPKDKSLFFKFFSFAQWILMPYVGFTLSSLPALEAQTRLIFNKRITYVESKKEK
jgi:Glycosyl transferase family group 2